jgi:hypothetical protein
MVSETPGGTTGTMDPVEIQHLDWDPADSRVSIHMHPGVVDGIAHDVFESFGKRLEVGGLLLGRVVAGPRPAVWIERYQRVSCEHRFGPRFILDSGEIAALEESAANILAAGELAVVGLYRSHTRPGFQLEESDFDLIRRYFSDPSDLVLLIEPKPKPGNRMSAQFHAWDAGSGAHPVGEEFPFSGHAAAIEDTAAEDETEETGDHENIAVPTVQRENPRRLVPDYAPSPVEPAPSLFGLNQNFVPNDSSPADDLTADLGARQRFKKWWPLPAALVLAGGILWLVLQPAGHLSFNSANPAPAQTAETVRPIGLYVDASGQSWRVLWNPKATALQDARSVQLFVREKDDQNRIDLSPRDLASGSYEYRPAAPTDAVDVTFRLEVVDRAGLVSGESFRLMQTPRVASPVAPSPSPETPARIVQPKAIYRAPPVIAAGIRPRIKGTISIDVRVHIDTRGRVVSAAPVTKPHSGLDRYLAGRAVQAARQWRFEPARENGTAAAGSQILHFVFEK